MLLKNWVHAKSTVALFAELKNIYLLLSDKRQLYGRLGELVASVYLQIKGYKILFRNKRIYHKEIDLIAIKNKSLVIIEVKSGFFNSRYDPHSKINKKKRENIIFAAQAFKKNNNRLLKLYKIKHTRYDVIFINYGKAHPNLQSRIDHITSYYQPKNISA